MAKRLYTEDDVRRLAPGSELVLDGSALATPAALDLARARGVAVRFDRAARASGGGAGDPLWERMLARDGTYLVHVLGGRARTYRLEDRGPVPLEEGAR